METGKTCKTCNEYKIIDDYYYNRKFDYYSGECKDCSLIKKREYYHKNKESILKKKNDKNRKKLKYQINRMTFQEYILNIMKENNIN